MEKKTRTSVDKEWFSNLEDSDIEQVLEITERKEDLNYGIAFTVMEYADRIGDDPFACKALETVLNKRYEKLQDQYPDVEKGYLNALWKTATRHYRNSVEKII